MTKCRKALRAARALSEPRRYSRRWQSCLIIFIVIFCNFKKDRNHFYVFWWQWCVVAPGFTVLPRIWTNRFRLDSDKKIIKSSVFFFQFSSTTMDNRKSIKRRLRDPMHFANWILLEQQQSIWGTPKNMSWLFTNYLCRYKSRPKQLSNLKHFKIRMQQVEENVEHLKSTTGRIV